MRIYNMMGFCFTINIYSHTYINSYHILISQFGTQTHIHMHTHTHTHTNTQAHAYTHTKI